MKGKWAIAIGLVLSMVLIPSALAGAGQTFVVIPTGVDDTAAIQQALDDALAAGPGSVVELAAGDFYITAPVVVTNFDGTLRGQGPDATVLHILPDVLFPATLHDPWLSAMWGRDWYWPVMLTFYYDNHVTPYQVNFHDLGFHLVGKGEVWPWVIPADMVFPIMVEGIDFSGPSLVSTTWRNMSFAGDEGGAYLFGRNMADAICLVSLSGTHTVSGSSFDTMFGLPVNSAILGAGALTVGGAGPQDHITMRKAGYGGVQCWACRDTALEISNVEAHDLDSPVLVAISLDHSTVHIAHVDTYNAAAAIVMGSAGQPSTYLFEHNTVRSASAGFSILETNPAVRSQVVIRNNYIEGTGELATPILTSGAQGAVITNNRITGSGVAAMLLGADGADDSGLLVKGNNVQGWHGGVPIWLGAGTSGITVVGSGNLRTNVFDESGGANILVGVNSQGAHIGQVIRDAMQARIAAKKLFMYTRPY